MFGLAQARPADLPADDGAARARFVDAHNRRHLTPLKKAARRRSVSTRRA
jgi:hypothetical protein